ncbi:hypothetical protein HKD37_07G019368 [Glycine soja]
MYQLLQASKWSGNECCPPLEAMKALVDGGQGLEIFLEFEARKIPPEIKRGKVRRKLIEDWLPVLVVCKDWLANAVDIGSILDMMNKVAACAKHYVGDDGTTKGINENNIVASYNGLLRIHIGL